MLDCPAMGLVKQLVFCLCYGSCISGSSSGGGGLVLLVLYLASATLFLIISLLVVPLSNLHYVFSDGPICFFHFPGLVVLCVYSGVCCFFISFGVTISF